MVKLASHNRPTGLADTEQAGARDSDQALNHYELRFRLSSKLQSSLEHETVLSTFFDQLQSLVRCSGMSYTNRDIDSTIQFGRQSKHSVEYLVSVDNEKLGRLRFQRNVAFAEAEMATIEMLIGTLCHPLRNALRYRAAVESALTDNLTGVSNRSALKLVSERELKLAKRYKKNLSILLFDIDYFKTINDRLGHASGDLVIKRVAELITQGLRETDQVFRYGGEEFLAILPETEPQNALVSAERVRSLIQSSPFATTTEIISISVSVGIASLRLEDSFTSLFTRADQALYRAKHAGRNNCVQDGAIAEEGLLHKKRPAAETRPASETAPKVRADN